MKIFVLLFILQLTISPQFATQNDSLFFLIKKADPRALPELEEKLIDIMYSADYELGKALSDRMLKTARYLKNKSLYIKVLIHSYRFYPFETKIKLLNRAEFIAKTEKYDELLAASYQFKSIAFRDNSMTDSAMIYCLKARDLFIKIGQPDNLIGTLELIANMHYYAGQYDEAEKIYKNILKSDANLKQGWRYVTTINNLGLIRMQQKKYSEAEKYFLTSLEHVSSKKMNFSDSSGLAYLYRKLLEVSVAQQKIESAEKYFSLGLFFSNRFGQQTELPGIYVAKGLLLFEKREYDSALYYFNKAAELNSTFYDLRNEINIYDGLTKTFAAKKDLNNAYENLKLFHLAEEKSDSIYHRTKYMTLYAEYNYHNYLARIADYKQKQFLMIIVITISFTSLIAIAYFFMRLRSSNRKLVVKNIELANGNEHLTAMYNSERNESKPAFFHSFHATKSPATIHEEQNKKENKEVDEEIIRNIIGKLEKLMLNEKTYLLQELSINQLSEQLDTNRTYLSIVINRTYNVNFATYINDLRISEAIRIISDGEHKKLNINGIAQKVGFNNRVSFTKAFYKYTGTSPSFFIKNVEDTFKHGASLNKNSEIE